MWNIKACFQVLVFLVMVAEPNAVHITVTFYKTSDSFKGINLGSFDMSWLLKALDSVPSSAGLGYGYLLENCCDSWYTQERVMVICNYDAK